MVDKFPTTINTDDKIKAAHNATPSILEETIFAEPVAFAQSEYEYEHKKHSLRCYSYFCSNGTVKNMIELCQ